MFLLGTILIHSQTLKSFQGDNGKWGFKDSKDIVIVESKYDRVGRFVEGFATFTENGKEGYIDTQGKILVPAKYDIAQNFNYGFAMVQTNKKKGFINTSGKEITPLKYDYLSLFYEGLAAVVLNGKSGYINTSGKEVIPLVYDEAWDFKNAKAEVRIAGRKFFIDKNGNDLSNATTNSTVNNKSTNNGDSEYVKGYEALQKNNNLEAMKWFKISAEKGNPDGMAGVGLMHLEGIGGATKSFVTALEWYQKAVQANSSQKAEYMKTLNQLNNGLAELTDGSFLFKAGQYDKAKLLFLKGEQKGNIQCSYMLGTIFYSIEKDYPNAKIHFQKAVDKGDQKAKEALQIMAQSENAKEKLQTK